MKRPIHQSIVWHWLEWLLGKLGLRGLRGRLQAYRLELYFRDLLRDAERASREDRFRGRVVDADERGRS